jgi:acyl-[acyl-carrier-protein]-phospholipid O-acyltransferase/long-chain-fatty-acid--[acyl-carrier-protein] ligase
LAKLLPCGKNITGDKGKIDQDGFVTIVDRYSRFAKIGGEMISLGSCEEQMSVCLGDGYDKTD